MDAESTTLARPHFMQRMLRRLKDSDFHWPAVAYRRLLRGVTFIGVTGSCGKTTTVQLITAMLGARFRGGGSHGSMNLPPHIAKTILDARPWDDFCVIEIAAAKESARIALERPLRMVRPQIGVVTNIGADHISAFGSQEAIAAEKGKLIAALACDGTAVLNADDPNVLAMSRRCAGRVLTYGLSPAALVRAVNVRSAWPERLRFTVGYQGRWCEVETQLCGSHWVSCALAALAVGLAMKIPMEDAARALGAAAPPKGRMYPMTTPGGVTFIRDDAKAPLGSIPHALQFMKDATARRKVIVFGTISDYSGNSDRKYISVARQALDVADEVIFAGVHAGKAAKAGRDARPGALRTFYSTEAAAGHLGGRLQPGDLVLLKGGHKDELGAVMDAQISAETRGEREARSGLQPNGPPAHAIESPDGIRLDAMGWKLPVRVVVGLGNPGERYAQTPHNIGQRVLDAIAGALRAQWQQTDDAVIARVEWGREAVYLVKPLAMVNDTGPVLLRLRNELKFQVTECVLIQDEIDLPLGTVRVHTHAGDGGHRGVRSVFETFQTSAIRRVRVGVGRPGQKDGLSGYVLEPFAPSDTAAVEAACEKAAQRILDLLPELREAITACVDPRIDAGVAQLVRAARP